MTRSKFKEVVEKGVVRLVDPSARLSVCDVGSVCLSLLTCFLSGDSSLEHFSH